MLDRYKLLAFLRELNSNLFFLLLQKDDFTLKLPLILFRLADPILLLIQLPF